MDERHIQRVLDSSLPGFPRSSLSDFCLLSQRRCLHGLGWLLRPPRCYRLVSSFWQRSSPLVRSAGSTVSLSRRGKTEKPIKKSFTPYSPTLRPTVKRSNRKDSLIILARD